MATIYEIVMSLTLSLVIFLAAGLIGGVLLGLIGVGMALIAVPLLAMTLPYFGIGADVAPLTALATSMAIVAVGSVSSVWSHHRLGNVDWALVKVTVPASLIGVAAGSLVASRLPGGVLKWIFCAFLLLIAVRMLLPQKVQAEKAPPTGPWTYRIAGSLIGIAGSLIGAGGGVFMVPFLNSRGHAMRKAVATSTTIGLPVSIVGAIVYALQGYVFIPAFIGVSLGSIIGAPLGARLASRVPGGALKTGFAVLLIVLAVKLALG